ncbi:MAG: iron-sulfur cluster-binding domain-containing protein [Spirochaetota bacterium]|nr:iron-sulfur cluster-binding domain-containing protein [Spirochaetota bacterium]
MDSQILKQLEGYDRVITDIDVLKRYGYDYRLERGLVKKYVERLHPQIIDVKVIDIIEETKSTKTLRLASKQKYLPPFQAGQYISVIVEINGIRTSRPYSISSSPDEIAYYDITVRRVEGGLVSNHLLDSITIGDSLQISGPAGNFYHNPIIHGTKLVCIAGGSGVTPFKSMIQHAVNTGTEREIWLIYGSKNADELIFDDYFVKVASKYKFFHYIPVLEEGSGTYKGYITAKIIKEVVGDSSDKTFFVCGPQALYEHLLKELKPLTLKPKQLRLEMYGVPADVFAQPGWPKDISRNSTFVIKIRGKKDITVNAGEPILQSLEKNGIVVPSLCRSGECSLCRVKLVSGKVYQPEGVKLRQADRRFGYIHSCAAFPISDCEIII